jgi:hypothetical protein
LNYYSVERNLLDLLRAFREIQTTIQMNTSFTTDHKHYVQEIYTSTVQKYASASATHMTTDHEAELSSTTLATTSSTTSSITNQISNSSTTLSTTIPNTPPGTVKVQHCQTERVID